MFPTLAYQLHNSVHGKPAKRLFKHRVPGQIDVFYTRCGRFITVPPPVKMSDRALREYICPGTRLVIQPESLIPPKNGRQINEVGKYD